MTGILIGIVLVAAALLSVVFLVLAPPAPRVSVDRRLAPGSVYTSPLVRATGATVAAVERGMSGRARLFSAQDLDLAGVRAQPSAFLLGILVAGVVLAVLGVLAGAGTPWSLLLAPLFAALAPVGAKVLLAVRAGRRRARFADQLDDTLTLISGNLRAGYGLVQALDGVARDLDEPTSEEFARIVNETRLGREIGPALEQTADRMRSDDFRWAAQAIATNRETGGNLAEVLDNVAGTIRERNEIRRQVKALSAEGRLSAAVLAALPFVVLAAVLLIQPAYYATFLTTIFGVAAAVVCVVLLTVGIFWLFRVTRVRF